MLRTEFSTADFAASVHRQSWGWFQELPYRLDLAAEIVDDKGVPVLPLIESDVASTLRRLLTLPGNPMVRSAISTAVQSKAPRTVIVDDLSVACFPLALGRAGGALVLGRRDEAGGRHVEELETIGSWLVPAIEAHITNFSGKEDDTLNRVSALHRLLNHAVAGGSARNLVAAFAEAVAVWDDIEVRGYVEGIRGEFVLDVTLAGSDRDQAPAALDGDVVHEEMGLVRLSGSDAERLGFRGDNDVLVARFGEKSGASSLIALSGRISAHDASRLALYVDLLREAVRHAEGIAASRLQWAILQHLLLATDNIETAARAALAEVATAVGGAGAALIVTMSNGMPVLSLGDADAFSLPIGFGQTNHLASTGRLLDRYTMVLAVRGCPGQTFIRREQQIVDGVATLFGSWLSGVLRQPAYSRDRRATRHRFEDVIERIADQTVQHGASVSVVVIAAAEAAFRPGLIHKWVADIRGQLRAADLVGRLTESEIAVLLSEATAADAAAVVERIRGHLGAGESGGALVPLETLLIGIATRSAASPSDLSVVEAAREDAKRACA